jgi:hypothetical protein
MLREVLEESCNSFDLYKQSKFFGNLNKQIAIYHRNGKTKYICYLIGVASDCLDLLVNTFRKNCLYIQKRKDVPEFWKEMIDITIVNVHTALTNFKENKTIFKLKNISGDYVQIALRTQKILRKLFMTLNQSSLLVCKISSQLRNKSRSAKDHWKQNTTSLLFYCGG